MDKRILGSKLRKVNESIDRKARRLKAYIFSGNAAFDDFGFIAEVNDAEFVLYRFGKPDGDVDE